MEGVDEVPMVEIPQIPENVFDDNTVQQPQSLPETLANLPVELLPLIFQHLSLAEQIICRAVCQDWKTETERVLKTTDKIWFFNANQPLLYPGPVGRCRDPRHDVSFMDRVFVSDPKDSQINCLMRLCPNVRVLVFDSWNPLMIERVVEVQKNTVECIRGSHFQPIDKVWRRMKMPFLHHVSAKYLGSNFILSLPQQDSLTSLDIYSGRVDQLSFASVQNSIEHIKIHMECEISNLGLSPTRLSLKSLFGIDSRNIRHVTNEKKFPSVTELGLRYSRPRGSAQDGLTENPITYFPNVKKLHIKSPSSFESSISDLVTPFLQQLNHLSFWWDGNMTDQLLALSNNLPASLGIFFDLYSSTCNQMRQVYSFRRVSGLLQNVTQLKLYFHRYGSGRGSVALPFLREIMEFIEERIEERRLSSLDIYSYAREKDMFIPYDGEIMFPFGSGEMRELREKTTRVKSLFIFYRGQRISILSTGFQYISQISIRFNV